MERAAPFDISSRLVGTGRRRWTLAARTAAALLAALSVFFGAANTLAFDPTSDEQTLFSLTNQDRTSNGVPALTQNAQMFSIARNAPNTVCGYTIDGRSQDMMNRNYFSHYILNCLNPGTPSTNKLVFNILQAYGISYLSAGENIGWTAGSEASAADNINNAFMNSPEHRANILNANYNQIGIGAAQGTAADTCCAGSSTFMFTEIFRQAPSSAPPPPPPPPPAPKPSPTPIRTTQPPPVLNTAPPPSTIIRNSPAPSAPPPPQQAPTPNVPSPVPSPTPTATQGAEVTSSSANQPQGLIELVVDLVLKNLLNI